MYLLYQLNMAILFPYNLYNSQFYEQLIIKVNCLPQKNEELSLRQLLFRLTDTLWQMKKMLSTMPFFGFFCNVDHALKNM